jgi:hypothetical protein
MKYIFLLFAFCIATTISVDAQTMIENSSRTKKGTIEQSDVHWESNIVNNSMNPVTYKVVINKEGLNPLHEFYFCWDNCYGPGQAESYPFGQQIAPNGSFLFSLHVVGPVDEEFNYSILKEGNSTLCGKFINVDNPADEFEICIDYEIVNPTSVRERSETTSLVSPNPASSMATIRYELPSTISTATLTLYNVTGTKMMEKTIDQSGMTTVNTAAFEQGAYYYTISTPQSIVSKSTFQVIR